MLMTCRCPDPFLLCIDQHTLQESVIVVTINGSMYGLHALTGEPLWLHPSHHDSLLRDNRDEHERERSSTVCNVIQHVT